MTEFLTRQVAALAQTQLQFSTDGPQLKYHTSRWYTSVQFKVLSVSYCIIFILLYLCAHHFVYLSAQHQLSLLIYRIPTPTHSHLISENTFHITNLFLHYSVCIFSSSSTTLKYVFIRKMLLFHIHSQCLFKDNEGLFCERSIYIYIYSFWFHLYCTVTLYICQVPTASPNCTSSNVTNSIYTHTPVLYYSLHHTDIHNMSILTRFFCKHFARNFHPYKVYCYISQFLFYINSCIVYEQMVQNRHQVLRVSYHHLYFKILNDR